MVTATQTLLLKLLTPEREVLHTDIESLEAVAVDGHVGILPNHQSMVTPLGNGIVTYVKDGKPEKATVMGGLLYTDGRTVTILSDAAETTDNIDVVRAQQAKERAEARLKQQDDAIDTARAERALARAMARLELAGK